MSPKSAGEQPLHSHIVSSRRIPGTCLGLHVSLGDGTHKAKSYHEGCRFRVLACPV